ncbi:MAG: hypothetical protein K9L17_13455 [Clostridiales bacterium]|nr:hypothetical protein [Clostridiales bacterium]MCF8023682.1 hypothetical protein [Clostridiales bacterium]
MTRRRLKTIGLIGVFVILMFSLTACSGDKQENVTWKVGHVRPADTTTDNDLHWFADKVKENTGGAITLTFFRPVSWETTRLCRNA